jgi:hypothetical protein
MIMGEMTEKQVRVMRAKYPAVAWDGVLARDPDSGIEVHHEFLNTPTGVVMRIGTPRDGWDYTFIEGAQVNWIEPYGDADEPEGGFYFEEITRTMLDPSIPTNEPQVSVEEGNWASPDHEPMKVEGDF